MAQLRTVRYSVLRNPIYLVQYLQIFQATLASGGTGARLLQRRALGWVVRGAGRPRRIGALAVVGKATQVAQLAATQPAASGEEAKFPATRPASSATCAVVFVLSRNDSVRNRAFLRLKPGAALRSWTVARTRKGSPACASQRTHDTSDARAAQSVRAGGRTRVSRRSIHVNERSRRLPEWLLATRGRRDALECSSAQPPR